MLGNLSAGLAALVLVVSGAAILGLAPAIELATLAYVVGVTFVLTGIVLVCGAALGGNSKPNNHPDGGEP